MIMLVKRITLPLILVATLAVSAHASMQPYKLPNKQAQSQEASLPVATGIYHQLNQLFGQHLYRRLLANDDFIRIQEFSLYFLSKCHLLILPNHHRP